MKKIVMSMLLFGFCINTIHAQNTEIIHVQDLSRKTEFYMDIYPNVEVIGTQKWSKILFKVSKNGQSVCADGNIKIYVDFQERDSSGKRETLDMFSQEPLNCKGYYSFHLMADSVSGNILFDRFRMLTTKKIYAIVFEPYYKYDPNKIQVMPAMIRVNMDEKSALRISKAIKKYVLKNHLD